LTLAVPTVAPPEAHEVGGEDCGPNTVNVIVPVGADPPASVAEIEEAGVGLPAVPLRGPLSERIGMALGRTLVSAISAPPHVEVDGSSPTSPP
jgi:hypothetical protein